ncbi:protein NDR1 [Ziziphus jujuba]|uniref:Protein NDR1 n=1 Tax=Ziziphus jujuba TaxID=326968 RepID=A0A6P4B9X3_ZIZJJ|nr:protein NDR1 [Ziziphus jujuba]
MEESGGCCRCCFSFIFTLGLTALFLWLSLRTSNPTCSIQSFYAPALNQSLKARDNTTIYFLLKLDNGNKDKGIYYDNINLTVSYKTNVTPPIYINNLTIHSFYQGHNKKAKKNQSFVPDARFNWTAANQSVARNESVIFRVDLATAVRFKIIAWKTKRHRLVVGADVEINYEGAKKKKKGIKLSGGPKLLGFYSVQVGILVNLLALLFLNYYW